MTTHQDVLARARTAGWTVSYTGGGHLRLDHPEAAFPVFTSSTPSDWRTAKNLAAQLRRALPAEPTPDPAPDRPPKRKRRRRAPSRGYEHPTAGERHGWMMRHVERRLDPRP